MERAAVAIGPDSGPMHIATAVGTPVVALFGATSPRALRAVGLAPPGRCAATCPARRAICPRCPIGQLCMESITPALVMERVEQVLAGKVRRRDGRACGAFRVGRCALRESDDDRRQRWRGTPRERTTNEGSVTPRASAAACRDRPLPPRPRAGRRRSDARPLHLGHGRAHLARGAGAGGAGDGREPPSRRRRQRRAQPARARRAGAGVRRGRRRRGRPASCSTSCAASASTSRGVDRRAAPPRRRARRASSPTSSRWCASIARTTAQGDSRAAARARGFLLAQLERAPTWW